VQISGLPDGVEGLEARGTLTSNDYARVFEPLVERHRQGGQRLRLLYQFGPGFNRVTLGALWADSRLGARYLPVLDGCAMVTDIDWIRHPGRSIGNWMPCPVRVYDNADRDDAARWLATLATAGQPSITQTVKAYVGGTVGAATSIVKLLLVKRFGGRGRYPDRARET
jgi:SpoIIAA-like